MISTETIRAVRERTDLALLVGEQVKTLRSERGAWWGECLFSQPPSTCWTKDHSFRCFSVSTRDRVYHCFGCKESGDCFTFLEKTRKVSFDQAVILLAERCGLVVVHTGEMEGLAK